MALRTNAAKTTMAALHRGAPWGNGKRAGAFTGLRIPRPGFGSGSAPARGMSIPGPGRASKFEIRTQHGHDVEDDSEGRGWSEIEGSNISSLNAVEGRSVVCVLQFLGLICNEYIM